MDEFAKNFYYFEVPQHYTWQPRTNSWQRRIKGKKIVILRCCKIVLTEFESTSTAKISKIKIKDGTEKRQFYGEFTDEKSTVSTYNS